MGERIVHPLKRHGRQVLVAAMEELLRKERQCNEKSEVIVAALQNYGKDKYSGGT